MLFAAGSTTVGKRASRWLAATLLVSLVALWAQPVVAATVYLSPSLGTYSVGSSVTIGVYVTSADQAMNAASGVVTFPADKLQVTSLNKASSVFNFWVQEPSYSNADGTVRYEGVVLNPGFKGTAKRILAITFKVRVAGTARLAFSQASVLANDGQGTNILTGQSSASLVLTEGQPPAEPKPPAAQPSGPAPAVTSATHPNEDTWYNDPNPVLNWKLPAGVTGVSVLLDQSPSTIPGAASDGLFDSYIFRDVADGTWYGHVRFQTGATWGAAAHRRVRIDTSSPSRMVISQVEDDPAWLQGQAAFRFDAVDELSGIDYYRVFIDSQPPVAWRDDGTHIFRTASLDAGSHSIRVTAFDRAGNSFADTTTFIVTAPAPSALTAAQAVSREAVGWMAVFIPAIAMLLLCLVVVWYGWLKFGQFRRRFRTDIRLVERSTHQAFAKLRRDVADHLKLLEKAKLRRDLTREETSILAQLKIDLDESETILQREMKDLEREL